MAFNIPISPVVVFKRFVKSMARSGRSSNALWVISILLICYTAQASFVKEILQNSLCCSIDLDDAGPISDCNCDFGSVNHAVTNFFNPLLGNLTKTIFFRYFRVDLEKPCPFWQEEGSCMMESCSVCACDEGEVPRNWMTESGQYFPSRNNGMGQEHGWITSAGKSGHDEHMNALIEDVSAYDGSQKPWTRGGLEKSSMSPESLQYFQFLRETEDSNEEAAGQRHVSRPPDDLFWTDMSEDDCARGPDCPAASTPRGASGDGSGGSSPLKGVYVNLLENPESYTGYSGESPRRVWTAIQEENCFGDQRDVCLEKRAFYRLMSGLQSSISTHIAKEYYFEHSEQWGHNLPLYVRAVGSHKDRLDNLYFAFLFTLRAVVKAGNNLMAFPYDTGYSEEDQATRKMMAQLVNASLPEHFLRDIDRGTAAASIGGSEAGSDAIREGQPDPIEIHNNHQEMKEDIHECRTGFNERELFQVPKGYYGAAYWAKVEESEALRDSFRSRFQNITRIMDCVTCDKCRVWGKLQILGLGTAIRILLSSDEMLAGPEGVLSRQEVVALVNTLHQLSTAVAFASRAADLELEGKLSWVTSPVTGSMLAAVVLLLCVLPLRWSRQKGHEGEGDEGEEEDDAKLK